MQRGRGLPPGHFRAELFYGRQEATDLYHGRRRESNPDDVRTVSQTQQARLAWQVDDRWRINLTIPRVEIETEKDTPSGSASREIEGLGDVSLVANLSPWAGKDDTFLSGVSLILGLKFPTGDEAEEIDLTNPTPPSLLQEGTGTWDPILGYRLLFHLGDFHLHHATVAQITGGSSDIGFEPGSVLVTRFGASTTLWGEVTPGLSIEGEFRDPDELLGNSLGFTGSSIWSITPSILLEPLPGVEVGLSVRIPVYYNVRGTQLVPGEFVAISVAYRF